MIAVVIPYFQREPGILRRALASVVAQQNLPCPVTVLVVDDASPVPAHGELEGIVLPDWMQLRVIEQANGGPGAARNTGLDAMPNGTAFVAFLDSDDEWSTDHLTRAAMALEQGFDFYFADHYQLGQTVSAFARAGRIDPAAHAMLSLAQPNLHRYEGDLFDQTLRGNVIGTSTVVYRCAALRELRFQVEFTSAGEDYLFWMTAAKQGLRVAFSSQVEATYGKGINVFAGSGWGTASHLLRLHQEIGYRKTVIRLFDLDGVQRLHMAAELRRLRIGLVRDLIHRIHHRKDVAWRLLARHLAMDPLTLTVAPGVLARTLMGR